MTEQFQQKDQGFLTYPTTGWHKALFKWPVHMWRMGLAPIIGHHMVLITTTGRKTGLPRRTMTEVYKINDRKYAPCAFGRRAHWYLNIEADPRVTIQTADGVEAMRAGRVDDGEELFAIMENVKKRAKVIYDLYLETLEVEPTLADFQVKKDRFYWIRFDPTDELTPPPLESDLVWVWPLGLSLLVVGWLGFKLSGKNK